MNSKPIDVYDDLKPQLSQSSKRGAFKEDYKRQEDPPKSAISNIVSFKTQCFSQEPLNLNHQQHHKQRAINPKSND